MDPIVAVYNIKLTVRSADLPSIGLTNEEVGEAVANGLSEAITEQVHVGDGEAELSLEINATTVERVDD